MKKFAKPLISPEIGAACSRAAPATTVTLEPKKLGVDLEEFFLETIEAILIFKEDVESLESFVKP